MQRIDTLDELFAAGNPATGTKGTVVTAAWLNAIQEELAVVVEGLGGTLDPEDSGQIFDALLAFFAPILGSAAQVFRVATAVGATDATPLAQVQSLISSLGQGDVKYSDTRFYIGSLTRATSAAPGSVAYTGLPFTPKALIALGVKDSAVDGFASWGMSTGGAGSEIYVDDSVPGNFGGTAGGLVTVYDSGVAYIQGAIASFDAAPGFTINWSKVGSPASRTVTVYYLALR